MDETYNVFVGTTTDCPGVIAPELLKDQTVR